jgi:hypothetical protein
MEKNTKEICERAYFFFKKKEKYVRVKYKYFMDRILSPLIVPAFFFFIFSDTNYQGRMMLPLAKIIEETKN